MNEKIILEDPNGNQEERGIICYFKSTSDARPNIKNIPILVCDKNEMNNGNEVLEFFWEKDGLYQSIADAAAWNEVKAVFVALIKNSIGMDAQDNIEILSSSSVKKALASGNLLAVNPIQIEDAKNHFIELKQKNQPSESPSNETKASSEIPSESTTTPEVKEEPPVVEKEETSVIGEPPVTENPVSPVPETPVASTETAAPPEVKEEPSVVEKDETSVLGKSPVTENPVPPAPETPVASTETAAPPEVKEEPSVVEKKETSVIGESPVMENPVPPASETVVEEKPSGVEIIPTKEEVNVVDKIKEQVDTALANYNAKVTELITQTVQEINHFTESVKEEINTILETHKNDIQEEQTKIVNLHERAMDFLKNAQSAEQVAMIAKENAMQMSQVSQATPVMENPVPPVPETPVMPSNPTVNPTGPINLEPAATVMPESPVVSSENSVIEFPTPPTNDATLNLSKAA